jgi:tetratricopeptide (TPR) repeat protein
MASLITLKGIDQAISDLNYQNKQSLKYRLVTVLRQFYEDETSIESLRDIGADELIEVLWGIADEPATTKKKRKNLSKIRYSVNADLRALYRKGKNPEGIIIGPTNTFRMSDEAKDRALRALLADKISAEEPDADEAELDYGLPGKTESDAEVMNEDDILQAIQELDENYPTGDLEKVEVGDDLGERTLDADLEEIERPQEMQAVSTPPEATGEAESEAERPRESTEEMEDEEGLGEISFDPEETQYLTVPEDEIVPRDLAEGEAPGGITGSQDTIDDERAPVERPDYMSTADSEEKAFQEDTQGADARSEPVLGKAQDKHKDHKIEGIHRDAMDEEGLGEISFDLEETQYLTVPEDEAMPPDVAHGDAQAGITGSQDTMDDEQAPLEQPDFMRTADSEEKAARPQYPKIDTGREASGGGARKKGSAQVPASSKRANRAIKQMEEALARRPDDIGLLQQLAQAKESSGDLQAALSLYQKIIDLYPGEDSAEEACLRLTLKLLDKKE